MPITLSLIFNYFFGSTTLIAIYIAWKSRKSSIKQAEATALETIDSIYDKMSTRVDKEMAKYQKIIDKQDEKIEKQSDEIGKNRNEIKETNKLLDQYVNQCKTCVNNKMK